MSDTVDIGGQQVPITELAAWYAKREQIEREIKQTQEALNAANGQLTDFAAAKEAIERLKTDPEYAKQFSDAISQHHADSAFFQQTPSAPIGPEGEGTPPVTTPPATPPAAPAAPVVDPHMAQQVERLERQIQEMQATSFVDAKLKEIHERYPSLDPQKVLERTLESKYPIEHLELVAGTMESERLSGVLAERSKSSSMLDALLAPNGEDLDSQLAALGSSLSVAQIDGDAGVDHAALSTEDHVLKAMAEVGLGSNNPT